MTQREKVNILIVDDQPAKLMSLEAVLADLGENLIKAESADEALKAILATDVAVLLVDVCMPRMDGFELAELVRNHPRFKRTAIIFISAVHLTDADRLRGYDLGAVDYIPVPIIPQVLKAKVAVFAELYRKTRELERLNSVLEERVAELAQSQERLRIADRMATIGTLAAGLGHDMGNLLLPVRMRLDSLERCELPPGGQEDIAVIRRSTEYLRRLASSLRLLALEPRGAHAEREGIDLALWWTENQGMIRNALPRASALAAEFPPDLPLPRIDRAGLTQIVFNLVQNAGDALRAMPSGRVQIQASGSQDQSSVTLTIRDNGAGMDAETRRRCFEPFFTTKTRELGTGLGLALVSGLVKNCGGSIQLDTEPGKGACFSIVIPSIPRREVDLRKPGRRGTAVVSIPDARLSAHVRNVLQGLNYLVGSGDTEAADLLVIATDGNGAIDRARSFAGRRPGARVLIFGVPGASAHHDGLVWLEPDLKPSLLHSRICRALALSSSDAQDTQ